MDVRVSSSSDDAEESASGTVSLNHSYLELVYNKSNQIVGMRFNGITIPKNAQITSAYVQFQTRAISSQATSLTIIGQAIDNPPTFRNVKRDISSRGRTMALVQWTPAAWTMVNEAGVNQRTPNVSTVIQEIINRPGWSSGNSLVIIITGSGQRSAWSYNGLSSGAPLLHIEYIVP
jgi:hypothetical protein